MFKIILFNTKSTLTYNLAVYNYYNKTVYYCKIFFLHSSHSHIFQLHATTNLFLIKIKYYCYKSHHHHHQYRSVSYLLQDKSSNIEILKFVEY